MGMDTTHTTETAAPASAVKTWTPIVGRLAHHPCFGIVTVERLYQTTATISRWGHSKLDSGKRLTERGIRLDRLGPLHPRDCKCGAPCGE